MGRSCWEERLGGAAPRGGCCSRAQDLHLGQHRALVETTLDIIDAKKCGLCYKRFEVAEMQWDAEPYCYGCKDGETWAARRPTARERGGSVHAALAVS